MDASHCFLLFQIGHSQNLVEDHLGKGSMSLPVSEVVVDLGAVPLPSTCWDRDVFEAMGGMRSCGYKRRAQVCTLLPAEHTPRWAMDPADSWGGD